MQSDFSKILVTEEEIDKTVRRMAEEISRDYEGKNLVLLGILKGSVVFMGDLMKRLSIPVQIDFMKVSSYGAGTVSSGHVDIILDIRRKDLANCDILIVEDIIDSGRTLSYLAKYLLDKGARSVRTCTMLDKPSRREVEFVPDYVGKQIPDEFVVGYGLDYDEKYRALPYVAILKREVYEK
ncbi:MAG: hypoxanthine phosphoribosyltransferase [Clostridiales bacterium]|nr:hypoxanthine phosphoribosyltransferase [Clostridiales bacterium]MBD9208921.1 hypoxanthine phosphoribosyltransferase [Clostridiales bacterium]